MKKIFCIVALATLIMNLPTGCKTPHDAGQRIVVPCQVTDSSDGAFVAHGEGKSRDKVIAKARAYTDAVGMLSSKLASVAALVAKQTLTASQTDGVEDPGSSNTYRNVANDAAKAQVAGYRVTCEETYVYKDGTYGHFIAIEYDREQVIKAMYDGLAAKKALPDGNLEVYSRQFSESLLRYEKEKK